MIPVVRLLRRLPPLVQNLVLAGATVVVFLSVAEGVCRLVEPKAEATPVASYITDWTEWWQDDFYTAKETAAGWPPFEDYNSDGLRDREHSVPKAAGVRRLICLGDSTTAGYRIRPEQACPQLLQDSLDALGVRVEVFNVALGGWSARQELIAYKRIARKYRPDQVLVGVCLNDIPELGNNLSRPPAWLAALSRRSALVRRAVRASDREIRSIEELFDEPDSPRVQEAYRRFFAELRSLRDAASEDGASFGLLVFLFLLQIAQDAPPPLPQQAIAEFCAAERIPCLDLLPALRGAGDQAFVDYDHFSPSGCRVVADQILASGLLVADEADATVAGEAVPEPATERAGSAPSSQGEASLGAPAPICVAAAFEPCRTLRARCVAGRSTFLQTWDPPRETRCPGWSRCWVMRTRGSVPAPRGRWRTSARRPPPSPRQWSGTR
jgi:lysophospholipase L1-like esterase